MLGLYRSVVAHGGLGANEAYDAAGRYAGSINWVLCASCLIRSDRCVTVTSCWCCVAH